jgi:hypothetical protein
MKPAPAKKAMMRYVPVAEDLDTKRLFDVEPRGIEPLYPSDNHRFLTGGGPLNSTGLYYHIRIEICNNKKENPR